MTFRFIPLLSIRASMFATAIAFVASALTVDGKMVQDPETGSWQVSEEIAGTPEADEVERIVVRMNRAQELREQGNHSDALRLYRQIQRNHPDTLFAAETKLLSALVRIDRKQWDRAFENLQSIVDNHPDYPRFNKVIEIQYSIAESLQEGARLRLFWLIPGFRSRERAVEYYEQIVENAPFSDEAPLALLNAAELQLDRGRYEESIDLYDRFISEYPEHPKAPDAYLGLANVFSTQVRGPEYDQGATREAISYYEDFTILHSGHPRIGEAEEGIEEMQDLLAQSRIVIGDFYLFRRSNYHAARVFYNEAITIAPGTPSADEARERLEEVDRREGNT